MKKEVLKDNRDFVALYHNGKKYVSPLFVVYIRDNGTASNRFGISTGKVIGNAVVRNFMRRRVREILRAESGSMNQGKDVVITVRRRAVDKDWQSTCSDLKHLLTVAGLRSETVS